jgi:hypothetical protein
LTALALNWHTSGAKSISLVLAGSWVSSATNSRRDFLSSKDKWPNLLSIYLHMPNIIKNTTINAILTFIILPNKLSLILTQYMQYKMFSIKILSEVP